MGLFSSIFGFGNAGRASSAISNANIAAEHGVLNANTTGREDILSQVGLGRNGTEGAVIRAGQNINDATGAGTQAINGALNQGTEKVNAAGQAIGAAAGDANNTLAGIYNTIRNDNGAGRDSGDLGNRLLQERAASNPQFKFSYDDYKNDPAYQFEMEQGQNAIQNSAAARGLSQGGAVLADLTKYGQGLAATHYNDAFARAKQQFDTNQNATLANLQALINSGNSANAISSQAEQNLGGQIASNTTDAAAKNATLQQFLAGLNTSGQQGIANMNVDAQKALAGLDVGAQTALSGQGIGAGTTLADLGLKSAVDAGNFATGAGNARAAGIIGQGAAIDKGVSDLAGLFLSPGMGLVAAGGKGAGILGGLFG